MPGSSGQDTRRVLLAAAAVEFAQHGLPGTRVHQIVRRAGVNERMIYHHFGSKEGLYRAVLEDQWLGGDGSWEAALTEAQELGPREGLRLVLGRLFERMLEERPLVLRLGLQDALNDWDGVPRASMRQVPEGLRDLYLRGQREGVFRADREFDLFYLSALGVLTGITVIGPRFADVRERSAGDPAYVAGLRDRALDLVLDGVAVR